MSASREKRSRKGTQEEILNQKQVETAKKKAATKKNVVTGVIIVLVVALLIGSIVFVKGPYFVRNSTAVTVGTHTLSPLQVRYFYQDTFQTMISQGYGSILGMMYGEGTEMQNEIADNTTGQTWADMIMADTMNTIRNTYAFYDLAIAEGYTLSAEGEDNLQTAMELMDLYGQMNSMTGDDYIRTMYGPGADKESYEAYQRILLTVNEFQIAQAESYTYDDAALAAKYEADPSLYHVYTYHSYVNYAETKDENGNDLDEAGKAAAMEEAKAAAEEMAEAASGDLDAYLQACADLSEDEAYLDGTKSIREYLPLANVPAPVQEWMKDPARQEGDTGVFELEDRGYYVIYWLSSNDNDYDAYNVRAINISALTTDANGATTYDWAAAETELKSLQADIEASTDFPADLPNLVSTYTDDTAAPSGGLYEYVYLGQFDSAVSEWLYSEPHEAGDNAVIQGSNAYYYIYVEGVAGNYRDHLLRQDLMLEDYNLWYTDVLASYSAVEQHPGLKHMDTKLVAPSTGSAY